MDISKNSNSKNIKKAALIEAFKAAIYFLIVAIIFFIVIGLIGLVGFVS
jgi:Tfp pilus assembly protein PilX